MKKEILDLENLIINDSGEAREMGRVVEVKDGVVKMIGLPNVAIGERLVSESGLSILVLGLEEGQVLGVVLGSEEIKSGDGIEGTGEMLSVPVGEELLGRVVNALGEAIDGLGALKTKKKYPVEQEAPGVIERESVNVPCATGILAIDALVPVGRGQRELIIGDRFTGKTAVAIDTIINQKGKEMICVFVAIGQKQSKIAQLVSVLEKAGAMEYTIVLSASASDPVALQMLAPFAGCAMAEYFRDKGQDVLIVYDDLTKQAWAYRQISLGLRRPPGREAYPGDIFYLHSRLLERAGRLSAEKGGGSITALPIIETQAGDVSAYIPTNVISITDGQLYFDKDAFNSGVRPAIDAGLSVSRVGGAAQVKAMKQVSGQLRLDLAQYRDMAGFAQFGTDMDEETRKKITRGKVMIELLRQKQYQPLSVMEEALMLFAGNNGFLDLFEGTEVREKAVEWIEEIKENKEWWKELNEEKKFEEKMIEKLKKSAEKYFAKYVKEDE